MTACRSEQLIQEHAHQLPKLQIRFSFHEALPYPIDPRKLEENLRHITAG